VFLDYITGAHPNTSAGVPAENTSSNGLSTGSTRSGAQA